MPILLLILLGVTSGVVAGLIAWRYPRAAKPAPPPALEAARQLGRRIRLHPRLRTELTRRLDPESATGLMLTAALLFTIVAGTLLGLLAYLVRTNHRLATIDNSVAKWGDRHATPLSTHGLTAVTQLGSIYVVAGLAVVLAIVEYLRTRSHWLVFFIVAVVGGEEIVTGTIKQIVDRTRPTFNPAAATLGPSFPSGHSTTSAAFYACAALLLGRRRSRRTRAILAGAAVGIPVAVASSRVLLDVHWLTDVIGGLSLGWSWFAICAVAFGGRILRFGVAAEVVSIVAEPEIDPATGRPRASDQPEPAG